MKKAFVYLTLMGLMLNGSTQPAETETIERSVEDRMQPRQNRTTITLFLAGDVMTGRGIDQVLPKPSNPRIYESYLKSAVGYVKIAEQASGPIPKPVDFAYIWGQALEELKRARPDLRIINLETSVTRSEEVWKGKGINYRMHPDNIGCLTAAGIDCCSLANNHVLDWGYPGLNETLKTLKSAGIRFAGAGLNRQEAEKPAILPVEGKGRVIVFSFGTGSSGIPSTWSATESRPGVNRLRDLSAETVLAIGGKVREVKQAGDIAVASIHWGSNWGYRIPRVQSQFAHRLIDEAGIDLIHGHSSHHPRPFEVYRDRLIIYGCGDFINDYEGIGGYEEFRDELVLMYLVSLDPETGALDTLRMVPFRLRRFRLNRASGEEARWLRDTLNREGEQFGTWVDLDEENSLVLGWE